MPDLNPSLFGLSDLKNFLKISNFQTVKVEKKNYSTAFLFWFREVN